MPSFDPPQAQVAETKFLQGGFLADEEANQQEKCIRVRFVVARLDADDVND